MVTGFPTLRYGDPVRGGFKLQPSAFVPHACFTFFTLAFQAEGAWGSIEKSKALSASQKGLSFVDLTEQFSIHFMQGLKKLANV